MKPVAWMTENGTIFDELPPISGGLIPLYTAPQGDGEVCGGCGAIRYDPICEPAPRELSDEEIEQIGKKYGIESVYRFAYYEFARAILKKASEK